MSGLFDAARIAGLTYQRDYLRGQVDCLIGNPANIGNTAYQLGYADAYALQERKTALTDACDEWCF